MNSTIKNSTIYLIQIAISGMLMLILIPIISRYIAPDELGKFVLVQVYMGIGVGIANFGMLLSYERNFFEYEKSKKDSVKLFSSAFIFVFFNLLILLSLVSLFQIEISNLILSGNSQTDLILVVLIGTIFSSLSKYYLTFLKNSGLAKSYAKFVIGNSVIYFSLAVVLMVHLSLGIMSLAYSWIVSNLLLFFLLYFMHRRELPFDFDKGMLKGMLAISLPLTPSIFFGFLSTRLDKILLGLIGSEGAVAIYYMGQTIAMTIFQFMTGLERAFLPEFYRKLLAKKYSTNLYEINNYIFPFFYITIFVALIVALFSKEFVFLFFSSDYQDAIPIVTILSIYYAFLFFGKVTGGQLICAKKTYLTTKLTLLGIAIDCVLNIPFIIIWGVVGAAWATTISSAIILTIFYYFAQKHAKISWRFKPIFIICSLFLAFIIFAIVEYSYSIDFIKALIFKFLFVFIFVIAGYTLNIVSTQKIKKFFETTIS